MRKSALYGEGDAAKDLNKPPWMEIPTAKTWVVTKMLNKVTHMQKSQIGKIASQAVFSVYVHKTGLISIKCW